MRSPHRPTRRATAVMLALPLLAVGCGGGGTASSTATRVPSATGAPAASSATASPADTPAPTPAPPPSAGTPLLIQVENAPDSRPQSGLSGADIVYEYETEGGISRFTTVFLHPVPTAVGPARSARLATIKLLRVLNGTLLFSGASEYVQQALDSSGLREFNEDTAGGALFRIHSRVAPHNLYTDGPHSEALLQRVHPPQVDYAPWQRTDPHALPDGGTPVSRLGVTISNFEQPSFTWDAGAGGWTRSEPTGVLTDAATGRPWQPTTIVVLQVPVSIGPEVEDVSGAHGLDFAVVGNGPGQLAVGGRLYDIHWTQPAGGLPQLQLTSGAPAPIAPGQVLVILVRQGLGAHPG